MLVSGSVDFPEIRGFPLLTTIWGKSVVFSVALSKFDQIHLRNIRQKKSVNLHHLKDLHSGNPNRKSIYPLVK